jgi:hypothetical protein
VARTAEEGWTAGLLILHLDGDVGLAMSFHSGETETSNAFLSTFCWICAESVVVLEICRCFRFQHLQ